jgi:Flp pilus assembly protein TadG
MAMGSLKAEIARMRARSDLSAATKQANENAMRCNALANAGQALVNAPYQRKNIHYKIARCEAEVMNDVTILTIEVSARFAGDYPVLHPRTPIRIINPPIETRDGSEMLEEVIREILEDLTDA